MRLLIGLALVFSFNTFAADWNSLEIGTSYKLTQGFSLPQLERSGSMVEFTKGEEVVLTDIVPLDMISVVLYEFQYKNCPGPEMKTDMEIIPVQGTSPVVEIGALLEKNCNLQIFLETRDMYSESIVE